MRQLNVLEKLDTELWPLVYTYRTAIQCEVLRAEIFAGRQTPLIFDAPPDWMAFLLEALRLTAKEEFEKAREIRSEAFDQAPVCAGVIDDQPFDWIANSDSRLGPVFEFIVNGQYYWAPFEKVREIKITPPKDLRDLVWLPSNLVWANGGEAVALIPTRYPGSEEINIAGIQMARTTRWEEVSDGLYHGFGQCMLATDRDDYPLLEIRHIKMDSNG